MFTLGGGHDYQSMRDLLHRPYELTSWNPAGWPHSHFKILRAIMPLLGMTGDCSGPMPLPADHSITMLHCLIVHSELKGHRIGCKAGQHATFIRKIPQETSCLLPFPRMSASHSLTEHPYQHTSELCHELLPLAVKKDVQCHQHVTCNASLRNGAAQHQKESIRKAQKHEEPLKWWLMGLEAWTGCTAR